MKMGGPDLCSTSSEKLLKLKSGLKLIFHMKNIKAPKSNSFKF